MQQWMVFLAIIFALLYVMNCEPQNVFLSHQRNNWASWWFYYFFFLKRFPEVRTLRVPKAEGCHQHQGEIIYLLLKKILGLAGHPLRCPVSPRVLPSDLPFSFNSALGLPYLEAVLILSAPSPLFIPPPQPPHTLQPRHIWQDRQELFQE